MNRKVNMDVETTTVFGEYIYAFGRSFNILMRISKKTRQIEVLSSIPDKKINARELVGKIVVWKNQVLLLPYMGDAIWLFSLDDYSWRKIAIPNCDESIGKYHQAFVNGDIIYAVGVETKGILKIHMNTLDIEVDLRPYEDLDYIPQQKLYFRTDYILNGSIFCMGSLLKNRILEYDTESNDYCIKKADIDNIPSIEGLLKIDNMQIFAPRDERYVYVGLLNQLEKITFDSEFHYLSTVRIGDSLYFLGKFTGFSYRYCKGKVERIDRRFLFADRTENEFMAMDTNGVFLMVNQNNNQKEEFMFGISGDSATSFFKQLLNEPIYENTLITLGGFLNTVSEM